VLYGDETMRILSTLVNGLGELRADPLGPLSERHRHRKRFASDRSLGFPLGPPDDDCTDENLKGSRNIVLRWVIGVATFTSPSVSL
jgi:hypothetical protein